MKKFFQYLMAGILAMSLAACGSSNAPADNGGGEGTPSEGGSTTLVVYSPNSDTEVDMVIPAFEDATGIKI